MKNKNTQKKNKLSASSEINKLMEINDLGAAYPPA